jgi:hypothetical protein
VRIRNDREKRAYEQAEKRNKAREEGWFDPDEVQAEDLPSVSELKATFSQMLA